MKGQQTIIDALNQVLTGELTAINQYFIHAKMCGNWGYARLHKHVRPLEVWKRRMVASMPCSRPSPPSRTS
jgi:bacterioferritin